MNSFPAFSRTLLLALTLTLPLSAQATSTRTSAFDYSATTGLLTKEIIEPDDSTLCLVTEYQYDSFGNKISATTRNCNGSAGSVPASNSEAAAPTGGTGIVTRTTSTGYDVNGQFPTTSTNALSQSETRTYNARFGVPYSLIGPNGLSTTWQYDGFGRKTLETRADGTTTNWTYNQTDNNCPGGTVYSITVAVTASPSSGTCYDMLNRELRSYTTGFDGAQIYKDTQYNNLGQVYEVSRPYSSGGTAKWSTYAYDTLGRITSVTEPTLTGGATTSTTYNGLTTSVTDANNHTTTRIKNSQGQLIQVTDTLGQSTYYSYDPFGNLTQTKDAKNNLTTLTYDLRGRKTAMVDPDMGSWSYQYDVLGQLKTQTDAKAQVTTMTYDKLGRIRTRTEPDLTSIWTYDTATKGIGKVATSIASNGFSRSYTYDTLGRPSSVASSIDTGYTVTTAYDAYGRPDSYTYPTGFATQNIYNAQGYLSKVVNKASPATVYWQATSKDAEGHLLSQTLGNGLVTTQTFDPNSGRVQTITTGSIQNVSYTFDSIGNLQARSDSARSLVEGFIFDELNRLKTYTLNGTTPQTFNYDEIGNITYKSDMGFYTYGTKPHAVTGVTGGTSTLSYTYDNNGNIQTGANRSVTWNSFNMVSQIIQGANTLMFNYDNDHARIKEVGPNGTTIYLNPRLDSGQHFEKVTTPSGVIEYKQYLYAGNLPIGVFTSRSNGQNDTKYFHTDHLGSIAVVTNESGAVLARYNYDPFGNRTVVAGTDVTDHGFTGHETMVEVGLVNMNGRVYDPALARFMSADPNIQAPGNGQSFNRYSYVLNNPLSYTDPSGFSWWTKFRENVLRPVVSIAVAVYMPGYGGAFLSGMISSSGDLKSGLISVATAGMFNAVGNMGWAQGSFENVIAHGAVGGISSVMSGGDFKSGFLAGGFTQAFAPTISGIDHGTVGPSFERTMAAAVVGGTASVLGGGKFANGAMTGAFSRLFNDDAHSAAIGATAGAAVGVGLAAGCDYASVGGCVAANPGLIAASSAAGAGIGVAVDRAWTQLNQLISNASDTGPQAYQYALVAQRDGVYPDVRGGDANLRAGDVWKYGTTVDTNGRYSQGYLNSLNVQMVVQSTGTPSQVLVQEKVMLIQHAILHGSLPPGNKIFK